MRCSLTVTNDPATHQTTTFVAAMCRLMPKSLEETVTFTNEDEGVPGLVPQVADIQQHETVGENERDQKADQGVTTR